MKGYRMRGDDRAPLEEEDDANLLERTATAFFEPEATKLSKIEDMPRMGKLDLPMKLIVCGYETNLYLDNLEFVLS